MMEITTNRIPIGGFVDEKANIHIHPPSKRPRSMMSSHPSRSILRRSASGRPPLPPGRIQSFKPSTSSSSSSDDDDESTCEISRPTLNRAAPKFIVHHSRSSRGTAKQGDKRESPRSPCRSTSSRSTVRDQQCNSFPSGSSRRVQSLHPTRPRYKEELALTGGSLYTTSTTFEEELDLKGEPYKVPHPNVTSRASGSENKIPQRASSMHEVGVYYQRLSRPQQLWSHNMYLGKQPLQRSPKPEKASRRNLSPLKRFYRREEKRSERSRRVIQRYMDRVVKNDDVWIERCIVKDDGEPPLTYFQSFYSGERFFCPPTGSKQCNIVRLEDMIRGCELKRYGDWDLTMRAEEQLQKQAMKKQEAQEKKYLKKEKKRLKQEQKKIEAKSRSKWGFFQRNQTKSVASEGSEATSGKRPWSSSKVS